MNSEDQINLFFFVFLFFTGTIFYSNRSFVKLFLKKYIAIASKIGFNSVFSWKPFRSIKTSEIMLRVHWIRLKMYWRKMEQNFQHFPSKTAQTHFRNAKNNPKLDFWWALYYCRWLTFLTYEQMSKQDFFEFAVKSWNLLPLNVI